VLKESRVGPCIVLFTSEDVDLLFLLGRVRFPMQNFRLLFLLLFVLEVRIRGRGTLSLIGELGFLNNSLFLHLCPLYYLRYF